jgi:hypothetical protein
MLNSKPETKIDLEQERKEILNAFKGLLRAAKIELEKTQP